jgi:hypothetical protein
MDGKFSPIDALPYALFTSPLLEVVEYEGESQDYSAIPTGLEALFVLVDMHGAGENVLRGIAQLRSPRQKIGM